MICKLFRQANYEHMKTMASALRCKLAAIVAFKMAEQPPNPALTARGQLILCLGTVLLVYLASPAIGLGYLAWLWFIPLGLAVIGSSPLRGALMICASAWLYWALSVWWLVPAVIEFTSVHWSLALLLFAALCLLCALPCVLFGYLFAQRDFSRQGLGILRASLSYTAVLSWLPSPIPGNPVHSLYQYPLMIQLLDLGGLPLLLFINMFFQLALLKAILVYRRSHHPPYSALITACTVFILTLAYGYVRLEQQATAAANGTAIKVGIIQPNLVRNSDKNTLYNMSETLLSNHSDLQLLVWPEIPAAFSVIDNSNDRRHTLALAKQNDIPLVVNSGYVYQRNEQGERSNSYYNASHLIEHGEVKDSYYKRTLVPFFEYLPFRPKLYSLFPGALNYIPGDSAKIFTIGDGVNIIPVICYEVIFPGSIREFVDKGGNIIINPVSDSWFHDSPGSAHHLSLALFRSVEYRIPLVRAANSGISAFVSASGEIIKQTPLVEPGSLVATIAIPAERSPYAHWGDWFLYLASLLVLIDSLLRRKTGAGK